MIYGLVYASHVLVLASDKIPPDILCTLQLGKFSLQQTNYQTTTVHLHSVSGTVILSSRNFSLISFLFTNI